MVITSIKVSFIAMGVIFLVLGVLIGVIQILVKLFPFQPSPPHHAKAIPANSPGEDGEHLAAIHAALAHHLGQSPDKINITNVKSLN